MSIHWSVTHLQTKMTTNRIVANTTPPNFHVIVDHNPRTDTPAVSNPPVNTVTTCWNPNSPPWNANMIANTTATTMLYRMFKMFNATTAVRMSQIPKNNFDLRA